MVRPDGPAHIGRMVPVGPQRASATAVGHLRPRAGGPGAPGAGEAEGDRAGAVDGVAGQLLGVESGDREHEPSMRPGCHQHKSSFRIAIS